MPETPTEVLNGTPRIDGSQQRQALPPAKPPRHRVAWIAAAIAVALVAAALAVIVVTTRNENRSTTPGVVASAIVYQQKLTTSLTPIVAANVALSKALTGMDGSKGTIRTAGQATEAAQSLTTSARGAVAILTVPLSQQTLNQQATQALTQENGYLQAVASTLSDPCGKGSGSLQSLAATTNASFVPLSNVAPGGSASITGVDNLISWASGATKQCNNKPPVVIRPNPPIVVTPPAPPTPTPVPATGLRTVNDTVGRPTIWAGANVSDGFARNVLIAAADYYQANGAVPDGVSLNVSSPATGGTYSVSYSSAGTTITAHNDSSSTPGWDNNLIQFPLSDADGTG